MKNIVLYLSILLFIGCAQRNSCKTNVMEWASLANQEIGVLRSYYEQVKDNEFFLSNKIVMHVLPETESISEAGEKRWENYANYRILKFKIHNRIFDLWLITGKCLYTDITCDDCVKKSNLIADRYLKFVNENCHIEQEELLRKNLPENIDLINSDYGLHALKYLGRKIYFKPFLLVEDIDCYNLKEKDRFSVWECMKNWYNENKSRLTWDPYFRNFNCDKMWSNPFKLPEVLEDDTIIMRSYFLE